LSPPNAGTPERSIEPVYVSNVPELSFPPPEAVDLSTESVARAAESPRRDFTVKRDSASARIVRGPRLTSVAALVVDQKDGRLLYAKNPDAVRPIASITKLMTAMVVLDSGLPLDETITLETSDTGALTTRRSRLRPGMMFTRGELLKLALMASENPAAAALARSYPGGMQVFVTAMNDKARAIGMRNTRFLDPTGLTPSNVATPFDLALMVNAAYGYPKIREFTTSGSHSLPLAGKHHSTLAAFYNSNRLVRSSDWSIGLSKTGFINEAGRCLVMQATIAEQPVIIVLLDSSGKIARIGDANRIKHWLEGGALSDHARAAKRRM
jgi:D-alanyl-D-alanine endopeptidase (penicillin-binding protein 7)